MAASIKKRYNIGLLSPEETKIIEIQLDAENAERERVLAIGMRTRKTNQQDNDKVRQQLETLEAEDLNLTPIKGELGLRKPLAEELDRGVWKEKAKRKRKEKKSATEVE